MTQARRVWRAFIVLAICAPALHAQDTRKVTEPHIPTACTVLAARLTSAKHDISLADESKLDTRRIQQAVDGCAPGQAVELRADGQGDAFLSGPIEMKAGVTVVVDAGVTLFASRNPRDYDVAPGACGVVDNNGRGCKPLLHFASAPNSGIMGDGTIDGRGGATLLGQSVSWWDLAEQARIGDRRQNVPRIIVAESSDNFTLYRITLQNSPNFHVLVSKTNGFTAWGVKINSPARARNTDGIDPSSSTNVSILYSYIHAGDDNVAIKAGGTGPSTHITIAHNHFYSGHGVSIGSETDGGASDIEVRDLTIDGADNGIRIKSDASRGGLVERVAYYDVCMREVKNPILMDPFYSPATGNKIPDFQGILLQNVVITTPGIITLKGHDADHRLKLTMDGVRASGLGPTQIAASHARLVLGPGAVNFTPTGEDVAVRQARGKNVAPSCSQQFVPYPGETNPGR